MFTGPYQATHTQALVRIKVWGLCDLPPANFTMSGTTSISTCAYCHHYNYYELCSMNEKKKNSGQQITNQIYLRLFFIPYIHFPKLVSLKYERIFLTFLHVQILVSKRLIFSKIRNVHQALEM